MKSFAFSSDLNKIKQNKNEQLQSPPCLQSQILNAVEQKVEYEAGEMAQSVKYMNSAKTWVQSPTPA